MSARIHPWIVSGVVSSSDWCWGAVGSLSSGLLLLLQDRRRGVGLDAPVLEISTVVHFAAVALSDPHAPQSHHTDAVSFAWPSRHRLGKPGRPPPVRTGHRQGPDTPRVRGHAGVRPDQHPRHQRLGAGLTFLGFSLAVRGPVGAPNRAGSAAPVSRLAGRGHTGQYRLTASPGRTPSGTVPLRLRGRFAPVPDERDVSALPEESTHEAVATLRRRARWSAGSARPRGGSIPAPSCAGSWTREYAMG
ncbi:hypothetical protein ACQ4WX_07130 [Streptomyces lasalocidi]